MCDYLKYERKFDKNNFDLEHNKITIGEYDERFRAIVDEIRADERTKNGKEQTLSDIHFQMEKPLSDKEIKSLQNAFGEIYERGKSDERRKFAEWLNENNYLHYVEYDEDKTIVDTLNVDMLIEQYEKEQKNEKIRGV